ncbi:MAG: hypothetical protein NVSMB29_18050 [Candidatus Dormibacteria bacterium]
MAARLFSLTAAAAALAALSACGEAAPATAPGSSRAPSGKPPSASVVPTPTPTPDQQIVQLVSVGVGAYLETTVPVAIVKNLSSRSAATNVVVHFRVLNQANAPAATNDTTLPQLLPGATAVVAARVQFEGTGFHADATLTNGPFAQPSAPTITASAATFECGRCGSPGGYGDVHATLTSPDPHPRSPVYVGAACMDAGGAIVGGGAVPYHWPDAGGTTVPVVLTSIEQGAPVASCLVTAMAAP